MGPKSNPQTRIKRKDGAKYMASNNTGRNNARSGSGKRTLQRLRREAGYRSAKEFAAVVNIPASTYARYENRPDGADKGMPLAAAWIIADKLGCTIDAVVGREDIDKPRAFADQAEGLSPMGQSMLADYLAYLQYRESPKRIA